MATGAGEMDRKPGLGHNENYPFVNQSYGPAFSPSGSCLLVPDTIFSTAAHSY